MDGSAEFKNGARAVESLAIPAAFLDSSGKLRAANAGFQKLIGGSDFAARTAAVIACTCTKALRDGRSRFLCRLTPKTADVNQELTLEFVQLAEGGLLLLASAGAADDLISEERLLELIGRITGRLGHDFNNLIGSIMGSLDLLQHKLKKLHPDGNPVAKQMGIMERALKKSVNLTDRMRSYVRADSIEVSEQPLQELIQKAWLKVDELDKAECVLELSATAECLVAGSEFHLVQIFKGLLENACDALDGRADKTILVQVNAVDLAAGNELGIAADRYGVVLIRDNGPGLSEAQAKRLFQPFSSGKAATIGKGFGLGLAMARAVLGKLNGAIRIESGRSGGVSVEVYLPVWTAVLESKS